MKKLFSQFIPALVLMFLFFSCQEDEALEQDITASETSSNHSADVLRTTFAKNLAVAVENEELRIFLKEEALKRFDGDYDILFNAAKNSVVTKDGRTFAELLQANWQGEASLQEIQTALPTLNILIPDLLPAPTELWDTQKHTPLVAVMNSEQHQEGVDYLYAYDVSGQQHKLPAFEDPLETTIIVENSERVAIANKGKGSTNARRATEEKWVPLFQDEGNQYYLINEGFLPKQTNYEATTPTNGRSNSNNFKIPGLNSNQKSNMFWAYVNTKDDYNAAKYMREAVYYGPNGDESLNANTVDRLQLFRFRTPYAVGRAADGWAEGDLELYCYVAHGGPESASFDKVLLTFSVPRYLAEITGSQYTTYIDFINAQSASNKPYWVRRINDYRDLGILVENKDEAMSTKETLGLWMNWSGDILNWSIHRYGDRLNFTFIEHDEGEIKTITRNYSVGFNASIGKKDTFNIGFTGQKSGSTEIVFTNNSDEFGVYTVEYTSNYFVHTLPVGLGDIQFVMATTRAVEW